MENSFNRSVAICLFLSLMICSCSDCESLEPRLAFTLSMDQFSIKAEPKGFKQFTAHSEIEIWAASLKTAELPMPGGFSYLDDRSQNFGNYILYSYKQPYYNKFNSYVDEAVDKGKYLYFQVRLKNEHGFSEFETYVYRIGYGLTKI